MASREANKRAQQLGNAFREVAHDVRFLMYHEVVQPLYLQGAISLGETKRLLTLASFARMPKREPILEWQTPELRALYDAVRQRCPARGDKSLLSPELLQSLQDVQSELQASLDKLTASTLEASGRARAGERREHSTLQHASNGGAGESAAGTRGPWPGEGATDGDEASGHLRDDVGCHDCSVGLTAAGEFPDTTLVATPPAVGVKLPDALSTGDQWDVYATATGTIGQAEQARLDEYGRNFIRLVSAALQELQAATEP